MTRDSKDQPAEAGRRHEQALQAFLAELRGAGAPCSAEEIREYTRLFEKLGAPALEITPEGWTAQAIQLLEGAAESTPAPKPSSLERVRGALSGALQETADRARDALATVRGVLVFDTGLEPLAGVRSTESQPRQILFAYPVGRLYLQVGRREDGLELMGQFVPTDRSDLPEHRTAQVTSGANTQEVALPENGEFRFQLPHAASLDLHLRWGEASLVEQVRS